VETPEAFCNSLQSFFMAGRFVKNSCSTVMPAAAAALAAPSAPSFSPRPPQSSQARRSRRALPRSASGRAQGSTTATAHPAAHAVRMQADEVLRWRALNPVRVPPFSYRCDDGKAAIVLSMKVTLGPSRSGRAPRWSGFNPPPEVGERTQTLRHRAT
jgi:hypothetical protein